MRNTAAFIYLFFLDELEQSSAEYNTERGEIIIKLMHCQLTSRQIVRQEQSNLAHLSLLPLEAEKLISTLFWLTTLLPPATCCESLRYSRSPLISVQADVALISSDWLSWCDGCNKASKPTMQSKRVGVTAQGAILPLPKAVSSRSVSQVTGVSFLATSRCVSVLTCVREYSKCFFFFFWSHFFTLFQI